MSSTNLLIDTHDNLKIKIFKEKYLFKHLPVIISKSFNWKALTKWNISYFKKIYPNKVVCLTIFKPEIEEIEFEAEDLTLELPVAMDLIYNNADPTKKYYLMQNSISTNFPELESDIDIPKYADNNNIFNKNLWVGESGVNTRPHYDYSNNFLTQIVGRKRVRLYQPTDSHSMYSYSIKDSVLKNASATHISRIANTDKLDYKLYPNFKHVRCFEGVLYPRDLLFIPSGWWHEIKSLDSSISVNFWWKVNISTLLPSQLTDMICSIFYWHRETFNQKIRECFDLSKFQNDLQIAEFALTKKLFSVSAIFLLSYINKKFEAPQLNEKILSWKKYLELALEGNDNSIRHQEIIDIIKEIINFN